MKNIKLILLFIPFMLIGQVGIETTKPTETLHVNGTVRLNDLPSKDATNVIATKEDGSATMNGDGSLIKDQTFNPDKTMVVDENGVMGYVNGTPVVPTSVSNIEHVDIDIPINEQTPTNSITSLGNISVRYDGTDPNGGEQTVSFKLSNNTNGVIVSEDNVIANQWKVDSDQGRIIGGQDSFISLSNGDWQTLNEAIPNVSQSEFAQYLIALINTQELYRVSVTVNPTNSNSTIPIVGHVNIFIERLSNQ